MTGDFDALFDSFRDTVFRMETLPAYHVGGAEADRIAAFQQGRPRPERSVRTSAWLARIAVTTVQASKRWSRVRVVDEPLTEYQRYQLESYRESQAAGEQVSLVHRARIKDTIRDLGPDFWLFDGDSSDARAAVMRYTDDGQFVGFDLTDDAQTIMGLSFLQRTVQRMAVPLNTFLAEVGCG